jgi:3-oxoacyl-[acyl-carrier-protein] synthase-3
MAPADGADIREATMQVSRIVATGSYLPTTEIRNADLTQFPLAALPLIEQKTGIKARRHAARSQCTSDLAIEAARNCLARASVDAETIDAIILATSSPDRIQPATATRVQYEIGAQRAFAFDVNSVCTGAVYAIAIADALIKSGTTRVLVIASELYSRFMNAADFSTFPYFGDGAGAVLVEATNEQPGILQTVLHSDGVGADLIQVPAGGTMLSTCEAEPRSRFFTMQGKEVYQFAIAKGSDAVLEVVAKNGMKPTDVTWVVSHQANRNIIHEIATRTGIPMEKFIVNLDRFGNTAGASVLIALDELVSSQVLRRDDVVVLVAFGGGLSWGATMMKWRG